MSDRKRLILEAVVALLLVLVCFAIWRGAQRRSERQLADFEARRASALNQAGQECDARAEWLAAGEARSVFQAFAAGIQAAALSQQKGMLDIAKRGLLRLPHVAFVHVLTPNGKVLTSSNEKYEVAGQSDARASWALQAQDLQTRSGDLPGTIEIAAPFQGASGRVAILWMGYKSQEVLAASRQGSKASG